VPHEQVVGALVSPANAPATMGASGSSKTYQPMAAAMPRTSSHTARTKIVSQYSRGETRRHTTSSGQMLKTVTHLA